MIHCPVSLALEGQLWIAQKEKKNSQMPLPGPVIFILSLYKIQTHLHVGSVNGILLHAECVIYNKHHLIYSNSFSTGIRRVGLRLCIFIHPAFAPLTTASPRQGHQFSPSSSCFCAADLDLSSIIFRERFL